MKNLKSLAPWLVAIVLGVALVGSMARAEESGFSWEVVMDKVAQLIAEKVENLGEMLGASGTRFENGVSADSTSPNAGQVRGTTLSITAGTSLASTTLGGANTTIAILVPTTTITAVQICDSTYITINASTTGTGASNDLVTAGTSTLYGGCLSATGKSHTLLMQNASTTVGTSLIYAGAGIVLIASPTTTAASQDVWAGGEYRRLTFTRVSDVTTTLEMYALRDAD